MVGNARHVGGVREVLRVATVTICRQRSREVVGVASAAGYGRVCAGQGKGGLAVVKRSRLPR